MRISTKTALTIWAALKQQKPEIQWSTTLATYVFADTGQPYGWRRVAGQVDQYLDQVSENMRGYTEAMMAGRIDVATWQRKMAADVKDSWVASYLVGRGDREAMTPQDWGKIGGHLAAQYGHLNDFAEQVKAGQITEKEALRRARLYARSGYTSLNAGKASAKKAAGWTEEKRVAIMDQNTCGDCAQYAAAGWQPAGTLPEPGENCACGPNCRCEKIYRDPSGGLSEKEAQQLLTQLRAPEEVGGQGFSYHVHDHTSPKSGLSVSWHAYEETIPYDAVNADDIFKYAKDHAAMLNKPGADIYGAWHNPDDGLVYFDVSHVFHKNAWRRAIEFADQEGQYGFYDLKTKTYYDTESAVAHYQETGKPPWKKHTLIISIPGGGQYGTIGQMSGKKAPPAPGHLILSKPPYEGGDDALREWAKGILMALRQQREEYDEFYGVTRDDLGRIISQERYPEDVLKGDKLRQALNWEHYCRVKALQREFREAHGCTADNPLGDLPDDDVYRVQLREYVKAEIEKRERPQARKARLRLQ